MRIFIQGAHGTGKSTLNNAIIRALLSSLNIRVLDSISERFLTRDLIKSTESDEFRIAQTKLLAYATNEYINGSDFISSRGFADSYAYLMHTYNQTKNKVYLDMIDHVVNAQNVLNTESSDIINIYLPIEFDIEYKDLRSTNKQFQVGVDNYIKEFLDNNINDYFTIKGTVEDRVSHVLELIKQRGFINE